MGSRNSKWLAYAVVLSLAVHASGAFLLYVIHPAALLRLYTTEDVHIEAKPEEKKPLEIVLVQKQQSEKQTSPQAAIQLQTKPDVAIAPGEVTLFGRKLVETATTNLKVNDFAPDLRVASHTTMTRSVSNTSKQVEKLAVLKSPKRRRSLKAISLPKKTNTIAVADTPFSKDVEYSSNPIPVYMRRWAEQGIQGKVWVEVEFEPNGKPRNVRLIRRSGHNVLDGSVVTAVKSWQARPKLVNGKPIAHRTVLKFNFRPR